MKTLNRSSLNYGELLFYLDFYLNNATMKAFSNTKAGRKPAYNNSNMQVSKKDLDKSQIELTVELSAAEFLPYVEKGAQKVSQEMEIEGFRPGKVPYEILKQKIGEMTILEEAARLAINKTIDEAMRQNTMDRPAVGQPSVNITKLAPNNPLEYKIVFALLPSVALGRYKDLGLKREEAKVEEAEVARVLEELRELHAKESLAERSLEAGDKVIADASLFLDKVPVENGAQKDLALIMGKNYFVPGFDDKLVGAKAGEEREFSLPYPGNHHQKNLAGKMVEFKVKIKSVYSREKPALDDKFAALFRLKDLAQLTGNLRENLLAEKKREADLKSEAEMLDKIVGEAKFGDLPDVLIENEVKNIMAELEQSVLRQGGKFEDYLAHLKKSKDELKLDLMPNAVKRVKSSLVIREVAIVEKISVEDKEVIDKIAELKKQYADNRDILKMLDEPGYANYLRNILANEKVLAKLKEWNYARTGDKQKS